MYSRSNEILIAGMDKSDLQRRSLVHHKGLCNALGDVQIYNCCLTKEILKGMVSLFSMQHSMVQERSNML